MKMITFGRTGLSVSRDGFGCIPIRRLSQSDAVKLLQKAYDAGINFFDTARVYMDSEGKIGHAFSGIRKEIIIATKSQAKTCDGLEKDLKTSLDMLKTDYIDIYQLHDYPSLDFEGGPIPALIKAKKDGIARFIGITTHRPDIAKAAALTGIFDTIQVPLNTLSTENELAIIDTCKEENLGLIAMKGLSGGLITKAATAYSFLHQYDNVVPIWGIQRSSELEEFIEFDKNPPVLDEKMWSVIEKDRKELAGSFCRGCGYCQPCPAGIQIETCARIVLLLARNSREVFLSKEWMEKMSLIENCINCGHCTSNCPYKLNTPELLRQNLKEYMIQYKEFHGLK